MHEVLQSRMLERFERDGALHPIPILSAGEVARYRGALMEIEAHLSARLRRFDMAHLFFHWVYELATHPRVVAVMRELIGPDLFLHSTRVFCKHPDDGSYVSWHQDGLYTNLNSKPAPSAWIALTDSTVENGCVRVIPGSHTHPKLPHRETYADDNLLNHGEEVLLSVDESKAVDMELKAGEMSIHHVNLLHSSKPNRSRSSRIGFSMSYIAPQVRRATVPVLRVAGNSNDHEFDIAERPPPMPLEEALARHAEFMNRHGFNPMRIEGVAGASRAPTPRSLEKTP